MPTAADVWIEAQKDRELRGELAMEPVLRDLFYLYDEVAVEIRKSIADMVARFATDNQLSYAQALKLLSGKDFSVWRQSIEAFLAQIAAADNQRPLVLELETLAMKSRITRQEALLGEIYKNMIRIAEDSNTKVNSLMERIIKEEYTATGLSVKDILQISGSFGGLDEGRVLDILAFPWSGKHYSEIIWDNVEKMRGVLRRELARGFIAGYGVDKMAKNINDILGRGKYNAERLVRTETSYFQNRGSLESYKDLGFDGYQYFNGPIPPIDICLLLNGKKFPISNARAGENLPPMHPNCVCHIVPIKLGRKNYWPDAAIKDPQEGFGAEGDKLPPAKTPKENKTVYGKMLEAQLAKVPGIQNKDEVLKEFSWLPEHLQRRIFDMQIRFELSPGSSSYNRVQNRMRIGDELAEGELLHEFSHALFHGSDLLHNSTYAAILNHHFGDLPIDGLLEIQLTSGRVVRALQSEYLVNHYQGLMTENPTESGNAMSALVEYFPEAMRYYYLYPEILQGKDPQIFALIEEIHKP